MISFRVVGVWLVLWLRSIVAFALFGEWTARGYIERVVDVRRSLTRRSIFDWSGSAGYRNEGVAEDDHVVG